MPEPSWQHKLRNALAELIASSIPYDMEVYSQSVRLRINVRRFNQRDDEIAYWQEELSQLPFCTATYVRPQSGRGQMYITFTMRKRKKSDEADLHPVQATRRGA